MDQRHLLPEPHEPVTETEVRALVKRFGERQAMAQGQTTVRDIAEALQVDPATVGEMLHELRASNSQLEIKQRLDNLEQENAELRERTANSLSFRTPFADSSVRRPFLFALITSIIATTAVFGPSGHVWPKQFIAIVLLFLPLYIVGRLLFRKAGK